MALNSLSVSCVRHVRNYHVSFIYRAYTDIPVINFPISTKNRITRRANDKKKKKSGLNLAKPGKVYISSNNRRETLFAQDFYTKFNPPEIAMSKWTSRKSPGKFLKIHAIQENPSKSPKNLVSFDEVLKSFTLVKSLQQINIVKPTVVQAKAIPPILSGKNVLFAAETGSGKTWAYLLPVMQKLVNAKRSNLEGQQKGPSCVVLVPTKELCEQVVRMGRELKLDQANLLSLTSASKKKGGWTFGEDRPYPDIVVATPVSLLSNMSKGILDFSTVGHLVIDECDTLMDASFANKTLQVIARFNVVDSMKQPLLNENRTQLILCSATFPHYARQQLADTIDMEAMVEVRTGYLHRVPTHVTHHFVRVRPSDKLDRVTRDLMASRDDSHLTTTIVFCNKSTSCYALARSCAENSLSVARCDGNMTNQERRKTLHDFLSGRVQILITTDLLSRGLNTPSVDRVINFEVPSHVSDYLHRCGRVGRVDSSSKKCEVVTYVSKAYETEVLAEIENAARRRTELTSVDANIKRKHQLRWEDTDQVEASTI